jgi:hypothetical protein
MFKLKTLLAQNNYIVLITIALILSFSIEGQQVELACSVVLEQAIDVEGFSDQEPSSIALGATVEYLGHVSDQSAWVLRYNDLYYLYPKTSPELRPIGCELASWGPPTPEFLPLQTIMENVGITTWHEQGYLGQGVKVGVLDARYDGLSELLRSPSLSSVQINFVQPIADLERLSPDAERTAAYHGANVLETLATDLYTVKLAQTE